MDVVESVENVAPPLEIQTQDESTPTSEDLAYETFVDETADTAVVDPLVGEVPDETIPVDPLEEAVIDYLVDLSDLVVE